MKQNATMNRWIAASAIAVMLPAGAVWAQSAASAVSGAVAGGGGKPVCVNAEINGVQALSYDCLSQQLAPTPTAAHGSAQNAAEAQATAPSNHVGTFNYSAESIRFGNAWGKSVTPQRPAPPSVVPLK